MSAGDVKIHIVKTNIKFLIACILSVTLKVQSASKASAPFFNLGGLVSPTLSHKGSPVVTRTST